LKTFITFAMQKQLYMENTTIVKPKRSVSLTNSEWASLKKFYKKFNTEVECALKIGIDRNVLVRVIAMGKGSEPTIDKILAALLAD
jgi:hypothetical protein